MDALDTVTSEQLETAFDQDFFGEGVPDLHRGAFRRSAFGERVGRENGRPTDSVTTRASAEQNDEVPDSLRVREVKVFVAKCSDGQGVDERVCLIDRVEPRLTPDVGQSKTVSVERDAADDAVHHTIRVGVVDCAKPQCVHHRDGPSAHRNDVADDSANAGRGTLEGLDVGGVVVALNLERDRPTFADVDNTRVLAHSDHEVLRHLGCDFLTELAKVNLRRFIRAVFRPHHGIHRQFAARRTTPKDVANLLILVRLEAEQVERLVFVGSRDGVLDGVGKVFSHDDSWLREDGGAQHRLEHSESVRSGRHRGGGVGAESRFDGVLGVRHEPDDVAAGISQPGDVVQRPVRVDIEIAEHHESVAFELFECLVIRDEPALAVLERDGDLLPLGVSARPRSVDVLDA